jgi:outer membrane protein assembly factor BamB
MKKILIYLGFVGALVALVGSLSLSPKSVMSFIFAEEKIEKDVTTSPKETVSKTEIELVPVYEKIFDEPIVGVIFDTATVTLEKAKKMGWKEEGFTVEEKAKEKVNVAYTKVVFSTSTEAKIYNHEGNLVSNISADKERIIASPRGEHILLARRPSDDNLKGGGVLFQSSGEEVWRKKKGGFFKAVSDDGYVIALLDPGWEENPPGDLVYYNPQGRELNRIRNPLIEMPTGSVSTRFTQDGGYVAIVYSDNYKRSAIILTRETGEVIWKRQYDYSALPFLVDPAVGILGKFYRANEYNVTSEEYIYCIGWDGKLKWMTAGDWRGVSGVKLSEDRMKIFTTSWTKRLWCLDVNTGKVLWDRKEDLSPDRLEVVRNYVYISIFPDKARGSYATTVLIFEAKEGHLIKRIDYPYKIVLLRSFEDKIFLAKPDEWKVRGLVLQEARK